MVGCWFRRGVTGAGRTKQLLGDGKLFLSQTDYRTESQARQYKVVCLACLVNGGTKESLKSSLAKATWSGTHYLQLSKSFIITRHNKAFSRGNLSCWLLARLCLLSQRHPSLWDPNGHFLFSLPLTAHSDWESHRRVWLSERGPGSLPCEHPMDHIL